MNRMMKVVVALLGALNLLVFTTGCQTISGEQNWENEMITLDGAWKFQLDPDEVGEAEGWQSPEFDDASWREISVPGDWGEQDGVGWYRMRIDVPESMVDREDMYLLFRQTDDHARLFLMVSWRPRIILGARLSM